MGRAFAQSTVDALKETIEQKGDFTCKSSLGRKFYSSKSAKSQEYKSGSPQTQKRIRMAWAQQLWSELPASTKSTESLSEKRAENEDGVFYYKATLKRKLGKKIFAAYWKNKDQHKTRLHPQTGIRQWMYLDLKLKKSVAHEKSTSSTQEKVQKAGGSKPPGSKPPGSKPPGKPKGDKPQQGPTAGKKRSSSGPAQPVLKKLASGEMKSSDLTPGKLATLFQTYQHQYFLTIHKGQQLIKCMKQAAAGTPMHHTSTTVTFQEYEECFKELVDNKDLEDMASSPGIEEAQSPQLIKVLQTLTDKIKELEEKSDNVDQMVRLMSSSHKPQA